MAKKTQAEWEKKLEDVIVELIKTYHIDKNDEDDFAQEIRIYSFLNIDRAPHKGIFLYNLKKGVGIQKIVSQFVVPESVEICYLEDSVLEEYSMFPEVYRHEIMETVLKLVSNTKKHYSQRDKYIPYASRYGKLVNRNMEIFLRRILYDETYAEIAKEYGLSHERVRGIVAKYMRFLRRPMYSKILYAYNLDDLR